MEVPFNNETHHNETVSLLGTRSQQRQEICYIIFQRNVPFFWKGFSFTRKVLQVA